MGPIWYYIAILNQYERVRVGLGMRNSRTHIVPGLLTDPVSSFQVIPVPVVVLAEERTGGEA